MSYTTMLSIEPDKPVYGIHEFQNAWGSAMRVWTPLAQRFFGKNPLLLVGFGDGQEFWDLVKDSRLTNYERIVFAWTFDRMICERERAGDLARAMQDFAKLYPVGGIDHLPAIAVALDLHVGEDPDRVGFGWIQTSVADDVWDVPNTCRHEFHSSGANDSDCPECGNPKDEPGTHRRFCWNLDKDKGLHVMLFETYGGQR